MVDAYEIQKLILNWLALQAEPVKMDKIRDVCNVCAFSVKKENVAHSYYRYFLPLLNHGIVECQTYKRGIGYLFAPARVFYADFDNQRHWLGINLSSTLRQQIPSEFEFVENETTDMLGDYIVMWVSPTTYAGNGLPVVKNPSPIKLLQFFPECTPSFFAREDNCNIADFKQIYTRGGDTRWKDISQTSITHNGLYRQSDQVYSQRIYLYNGRTYSWDKNNPDADAWAKIMHHLDHDSTIGTYDSKNGTIKFRENLPIVLARILVINQMFTHFNINSKDYHQITPAIFKQLQRIFKNKITEK